MRSPINGQVARPSPSTNAYRGDDAGDAATASGGADLSMGCGRRAPGVHTHRSRVAEALESVGHAPSLLIVHHVHEQRVRVGDPQTSTLRDFTVLLDPNRVRSAQTNLLSLLPMEGHRRPDDGPHESPACGRATAATISSGSLSTKIISFLAQFIRDTSPFPLAPLW
jgi:hypothetical protein